MELEKIARKKASKTICRFKISALGFNKKGEFLGMAFNRPRFNYKGGGIHAEMALLHRYGLNVKTIVLCRVGGTGDLLPIDPCINCKKVLEKLGIKIRKIA